MIAKPRVLVTGYGVVSAIDEGAKRTFFDSFLSAYREAETEPVPKVRPVVIVDSESLIDERQLRRMDRFAQLGMVAALRGMKNAEYVVSPENAQRTGIIFNTCFGPLRSTVSYLTKFIKDGPRSAPAAVFPYTVAGVFTGLITINLKALGTNSTISGCTSVGYGFDTIYQCTDDAILVGGCDEVTPQVIGWLEHVGHLQCASSPSPDERMGTFVLGEGAATILLEEAVTAHQRGAHPLAEILDCATGNSVDSKGPFCIRATCIAEVIRRALATCNLLPKQIGFVVSGANGMANLNETEKEALDEVFAGLLPIPVIDVKHVIGETFGAAGVFSVIVLSETLHLQMLPTEVKNHVLGPVEFGLALSYEFGGNVDCVVAKRYDEHAH